MRKLTDILRGHDKLNELQTLWGSTEAAREFGMLPKGDYIADIVGGDAFEGRTNGTPGYRLTFEVVEGEYAGSRFWHDLWFTDKAIPQTKRDLAKIGVHSFAQLDKPLQAVYRCNVELVLRRDGDYESNRVRKFDVQRVIKPVPDVFAPASLVKSQAKTEAKTMSDASKDRISDVRKTKPTTAMPLAGRALPAKKKRPRPTSTDGGDSPE